LLGVPTKKVRSFSVIMPLSRTLQIFTMPWPFSMVAPVGMPSPCGEAEAGPLKVRQRISAFSPGKRRAASSEISAAMAKSSSCRRRPGRMFSR
jgi:hypothetical protein